MNTTATHTSASQFADGRADELIDRVKAFERLYVEDRLAVEGRLERTRFDPAALEAHLADPDGMPYGRRVIYQDDHMEVILMNWGANSECLPHDHGTSEGWVKVLEGEASHVYYARREGHPAQVREERVASGKVIFAPRHMVHQMANRSAEALVTLHFYFPPISNMEVFDVAASRSAIVSADCGAWWPQAEDQLLECRALAR